MIEYHRVMLSDRLRTQAFKQAICRCVKKGCRVMDIGAGSGVLAFFACRAGAGKVVAVEEKDIIEAARSNAVINDLVQRIRFVQCNSLDLKFRERMDVIVSETLGTGGIEENIIGILLDARRRLLRAGGILIPRRLELHAALSRVKDIRDRQRFWLRKPYALNFTPMYEYARNTVYSIRVRPRNILHPPAKIMDIDFYRVQSDIVAGKAAFRISKPLIFNGFSLWFNAELAKGIFLSNSPFLKKLHWEQLFFPVLPEIRVFKGDTVEIRVKSVPLRRRFFWDWGFRIFRRGRRKPEGALDFSNFRGFPLSKESFSRKKPRN